MASAFGDTTITGTLLVNGVSVTGAATDSANVALLMLALKALTGQGGTLDGIIGGPGYLWVTAQSTPDLTVQVSAGVAFVGGTLAGDTDGVSSLSGFAAPATNPRIDIVQMADDGTISRKAGAESASPSAPSPDTDNIKIAEVYCRVGMTSVKDTDDASNGYITNNGARL